jgi:hypothetical protein
MDQKIYNYKKDQLIKLIENIILSKFDKDITLFYPKNKKWFQNNINKLKKIYNDNNECIKSLIHYKRNGYNEINNILYNKTFPLIYLFSKYNTNIFNKTKINTDPIYIFPNDLEKIKDYNKHKILNHIKNIDNVILNNNFELDDCILFRGYKTIEKLNKNTPKISNLIGHDLFQTYDNFIINKEKEYTSLIFNSFTLNPYIALDFIQNEGYFLILKVNKKDNIPGIFLSNTLFRTDPSFNGYNRINHDEMELLLSRNIKFKILKKKEIKLNDSIYNSINKIYEDHKKSNQYTKKIKIIYAKTLPFERPEEFSPTDNYKYICTRSSS